MEKQTLSIAFLTLITSLFCLVVLPLLPTQIPIRQNAEGAIDNQYGKLFLFLFPVLQLVIAVGFQSVRSTDPRRENVERFVSTCDTFLTMLCLLIFGMCLITVIPARKPDALDVLMAITLGFGFLSAAMGNLMPEIRQNYFINIKTPWALGDEDNWRRTHHIAGRLWFAAGLLMMLLSALPKEIPTESILGLASTMALVPYIYSYLLFRLKWMKGENKRLKSDIQQKYTEALTRPWVISL